MTFSNYIMMFLFIRFFWYLRHSSSFKLSSDLDSDEILLVTNTAVLGFFDEHLKSKDSNWLDKLRENINTKVEEFKNYEE